MRVDQNVRVELTGKVIRTELTQRNVMLQEPRYKFSYKLFVPDAINSVGLEFYLGGCRVCVGRVGSF